MPSEQGQVSGTSGGITVPPAVLALGLRVFRRMYARCREIAHEEIVAYFREAWRGDKFQWQHQLQGHGYELTQHGTYTFTALEVPAGADVSSVHPITYPIAYATGQVPAVIPGSHTTGWIPHAAPTSGSEETSLDLWVERTQAGASERQTGFANATVLSGNSVSGSPAGTATSVTYPTAFDSLPSLMVRVETVSGGVPTGIGAVDYVVTPLSQSAAGFTFILEFRPATYTGTTDNSATGITVSTANSGTGATGAPSPNDSGNNATETTGMTGAPIATGGVIGSPSTGNNSDGTDTGASSRNPTADQNQGHVHHENDAGGNTNDESVSHNHQMDHTHPHNTTGGNHTHPEGAHTHNNGDHTHNMNNHHHDLASHTHTGPSHNHTATVTDPQHDHTLTLPQPVVSGNQTRAVVYTAIGPLSTAAALPTVSWLAVAVQAS